MTLGDRLSTTYKFPNRISGIGWTLVLVALVRSAYLLIVQVAAENAKGAASGQLSQAKTILVLHLVLSVAMLVAGIGLIARQNWAWWTSLFFLGAALVTSVLELATGSADTIQDEISAPQPAFTGGSILVAVVLLWLLVASRPRPVNVKTERSEIESVDARTIAVLEATKKMSSRATEDWGAEVENPELLESLMWMTQARMGRTTTGASDPSDQAGENVPRRLEDLPRVFEASSMAIVVADAQGSVTLWNPACEHLLGFTSEEMVGKPLPLGTPSDGSDPASLLERTVAEGALMGIESDQLRRDGTAIPVSISLSMLPDTQRGIGGYLMAITDLSSRREALSEELERRRSEALAATQDEISRYSQTELVDNTHGKHAQRVMALTTLVAHEIGLDNDAAMEMGRAALLHDVGKVGIAPEVWNKRGRLTDEEFEAVKKHVHVGREMLTSTNSPALQAAADIAYAHHERWDGYGYLGLSGEEIPLGARIVAVADAFDALTHDRSYRKGRTTAQALEEIRKASGTQFDPNVVDAFLAVSRGGHLETINAD